MRSLLKRILQTLLVMVFLLLIFRGPIYRYSVKYHDIGNRNIYHISDHSFNKKLDSLAQDLKIDAKTIVAIANKITVENLSFTNSVAPRNPNKLVTQKKANCIGYSAMFNSVANYLIQKHNLQDQLLAKHKIGQLYFFGINLHSLSTSPFFDDHDYNVIEDRKLGITIAIDPVVSDYLWINRVSTQ